MQILWLPEQAEDNVLGDLQQAVRKSHFIKCNIVSGNRRLLNNFRSKFKNFLSVPLELTEGIEIQIKTVHGILTKIMRVLS